jgi:hypothetical protein
MSTDFSIKPVGAPVSTPLAQPVSTAASDATATVLPASQSVTAADASSRVRSDQDGTVNVSSVAFLDRSAGTVVFQAVNESTGAVISQFPDNATLRRRAYFHALDLAKESVPSGGATDRNA